MSNEKQTAVDLMFQKAMLVLPMGSIDARQALKETYQQAKEMEKKQIEDAELRGKEIIIIKHTEHEGGNK
jgi:hypothetical protein